MGLDERPIRVLLADDDPGVLELVAHALTKEGYVVETARNGEEAVRLARSWRPDALVLDVMMPLRDGFGVCRALRPERPDLAILMLTARDAPVAQVAGLDSGADDYLIKPFALPVLAARLRAVLRRRPPHEERLAVGDLVLDTATRRARRGGREITLTATEYRVLLQLMRAAGRIIPKSELTALIWGADFDGGDNVLEVYVRYLRQKLEAGGEPRLIQTARGAGYLIEGPR